MQSYGYIYQADVYCANCGDVICNKLRAEGKAPEDEMDHSSFDSDDFTKSCAHGSEESDSPAHCGECHAFLRAPLTQDGYAYVQDALNESGVTKRHKLSETLREWAFYYDFDYWSLEDVVENDRADRRIPGWYSSEMVE